MTSQTPDIRAIRHELRGLPVPLRRRLLAEGKRWLKLESDILAGRASLTRGGVSITLKPAKRRAAATPPRKTRRRPS